MRRGLASFLLILVAVLAWAVAAANPASAAEPQLPALTGRVVDAAGVLSPAQEAAIAERLEAQERATSNQVVVATVPSLQGYDIERFANDLFRAWRLGQQGRDNGVLLLIAPSEREVRIEVGYGLEGNLTDAISSDIVRNRILPRFRAGDLPGGILAGVEAILAAIEGTYEPMPRPEAADHDWVMLLIFILWALFLVMRASRGPRRQGYGPIHRRPGYRWGPGWGGGWGGGSWGGGSWGGSSGGGGFSGGGGSSGGGGASGRW